ncbi:type II toxin-antitoxin system VapB family antitoxin [Phyllobacterium sp. SB3]|uniref:type II toxin-antitoxin system VapB family antitoxin n=1 Tax=Phyllobacterium sp. SB3 TaxID=3156073 RepID=UPI0032AED00A
MPLYIKDDRIDQLARRYQAAIKAPSKTEAVRLALQHALEANLGQPTLAEIAAAFCRDLKLRAKPEKGLSPDKAFRDSLYD